VLHVVHADRAPAFEAHATGERRGEHGQVAAPQRRTEEGTRRAPAQSILLGELIEAAAGLLDAVEVVVGGHAGLLGGGDEHLGERVTEAMVGHVERPPWP
jgi:hypothetical protein